MIARIRNQKITGTIKRELRAEVLKGKLQDGIQGRATVAPKATTGVSGVARDDVRYGIDAANRTMEKLRKKEVPSSIKNETGWLADKRSSGQPAITAIARLAGNSRDGADSAGAGVDAADDMVS